MILDTTKLKFENLIWCSCEESSYQENRLSFLEYHYFWKIDIKKSSVENKGLETNNMVSWTFSNKRPLKFE